MKYDFDKVISRRNGNSIKWDVKENELPMWVADMDFEAAPAISEAIRNCTVNGIYAVKADATYLVWINLKNLNVDLPAGVKKSDYVADSIRKNTGLFLNTGSAYGIGGEDYLRLNIACPRSLLTDGLDRLKKGIESIAL